VIVGPGGNVAFFLERMPLPYSVTAGSLSSDA